MTIPAGVASAVSHGASQAAPVASIATAAPAASASAAPLASSQWFTNDAWLNGSATLLGALIGGYVASRVAYRLQLRATEKKEREQELVQAHQLMFCIIQQLNTILLVWRDHFSAEIANPGRFMSVPATTPFDVDRHVADVAAMSILLDCKAGRAVLYDLNIAQESYREALTILNERSRVHRDSLQPALEKSGRNGEMVTNELMMGELGERLTLSMMGLTDACYLTMHKSFVKLAAVKDKAREYIVERFDTDDFTKIEFPETNGIEAEPKPQYPQRPLSRKGRSVKFGFGTAFNWCRLWPEA